MAIGPVIGLSVFEVSPKWLFISVGLIFAVLLFLNFTLEDSLDQPSSDSPLLGDFYLLIKNRLMIDICVPMFIFMALYMQIEVTIPMFSKELFGQEVVSLVFIINALIVVFF